MINYLQLNILDMLEFIGEDSCQNILSSFICPLNPDVEDFIHTKAIPFARQHIAVTYLIFAEQNNQKYLVGYYTLTNKFICINNSALSKTLQKKIAKFSQYDATLKQHMISMPLIAQLGKNFASNIPLNIAGSDLLEMALERVLAIEQIFPPLNNNRRLHVPFVRTRKQSSEISGHGILNHSLFTVHRYMG